jgi:hypothetical protein
VGASRDDSAETRDACADSGVDGTGTYNLTVNGATGATGYAITFEDQPDVMSPPPPTRQFPSLYQGIVWNNWQHYAPYPSPFTANGVNAIYAISDGASFTFAPRVFLGAKFSRHTSFPGGVFFELYLGGALVATSPILADSAPPLTFLPRDTAVRSMRYESALWAARLSPTEARG